MLTSRTLLRTLQVALSSEAPSERRVSSLQRHGAASKEAIVDVHLAAYRNHAPLVAKKQFAAAWTSDAGTAAPSEKQRARVAAEAAKKMEQIVWSHGGVQFATQIVNKFLDLSSIKVLQEFVAEQPSARDFVSKDARVKATILLNLKSFVEMLRGLGASDRDRGAVHAVITACVDAAKLMRHEKTGRAYERALGVTYRLLNKCAEEREKMNDDSLCRLLQGEEQSGGGPPGRKVRCRTVRIALLVELAHEHHLSRTLSVN